MPEAETAPSPAGHIWRPDQGAHYHPGSDRQRQAGRRKLRYLDSPGFGHGVGMHQLPVFDGAGNILTVTDIDASEYRHANGLPRS
jgi:hypothetical protein